MALEERNGNYYYYKKERDRNRVISKYYGKGELASLIAQMDEIERNEKAEKIDRELFFLEVEIKKLTENVLLNLGFCETSSREWKLKKNES